VPDKLRENIFLQLFEIAEVSKFNPQEYQEYEDSIKYYRDIKNSFDTAREEGMKQGIEEGIEQGLETGTQRGLKQGIEQGRAEAKLQIAKKMLQKGLDQKTVAETTGLSIDQIIEIIKK
jgi:predicted transposase/invertase (TIGR01784 family)